ncbi:outer membrane beta-barrel protein [Mucilaginibacter sp.]|uniref:outer membrane beta-barrel protein n=1 Tax=Mucilaginibacter sp. TaxID=1882438 RepID=UPI003D0ED4D8
MVDKVQLYDKKSDQATFTGVDDGQKTKTINIKLKEDKKNGYFGKVDAGIGTDGYYEGQVLFNKFKAKQKFSVYGTVGNDGKTGLGWQDSQKYGSDSNVQFGDDGGIFISFSGSRDELDSFDGQYSGQGIPIARTGGVHYDTKWNGDKESINGNYKIGSLTVDGTNTSLTQNNTAEGAINGATDQVYHNYLFRQKMDATYTIKLDTTSNLKISVDGTLKNGQTRSNYTSSNTRGNGILQNTSDRNVLNNTTGQLFDMTAFYTKKFKKKGRTISLTVSESNNKTTAKGYLKSEADFFDDKGKQDSTQKVDQYKTSITNSNIFNTNIAYTEPLAKSLTVVFNYGLGINNGTSVRRSFDQSTPGNYNIQVDSLSNSYKLNELSNQVGAIFNYKKKKTTINLGTKVSDVHYDQMNEFTDMPFKRSFINWNPQATFQYQFSQRKSFRISYYGNTTQPTIDQIQPVIVNTDPLNTVLGNQDLRPSFANRFNINYNSYKVLTDQFISFYGNYSFTSNPIVSSLTIDSAGKTTNRYINLNKKPINYYLSAYFEKKVSKFGINVGLSGDVSGSTSYSLSNNDLNRTKYNNYAVQLRLSKYKENKYDFSASFGPNYTVSGSSLQSQINNNGRGFTSNDSFNIYLPGKFQIGSDVSYQFTAKTETFNQDFKRTLWNANISKTFLKANNLKASIAGNDLLNQNVGFSRSVSGNYISQNNYTTIKRYFMLSLIWDFNKVGGGAPKK